MTDWLDGIPLVDSHHHFWDLGKFPYHWLSPEAPPARFGNKSAIRRNYLPADHLTAFGNRSISASVHVQANCGADDPVEETRWLQNLSDTTGWPSAIVAEVDLSAPDSKAQIAANLTNSSLRGIRTPVAWDDAGRWRIAKQPGVLASPRFREAVLLLEDNDLCMDCVVVPAQLTEVLELAEEHPSLKIVINHFGTLEHRIPNNLEQWQAGIAALEAAPNVFVKLSGLWTVDRKWRASVLRPHVTHLISCLGAERVLYGSNLPVENVNCPVARQFEQLAQILAGMPKSALHAIFSQTARRIYRL